MKRYIIPLIFGFGGVAILLSLGFWQVQRLAWKEGVLAEIDERLAGTPIPLSSFTPDESTHNYQNVEFSGVLDGAEIHVLTSKKFKGAGYRVLSSATKGERQIWVDLGFIPQPAKNAERPVGSAKITGNLLWPDDFDPNFTPQPDLENNIWFARHIPHLKANFGSDPILIVANSVTFDDGSTDTGTELWPVDTSGIPNDHLEYAITWFSLAIVWAGMTAFLLWRIRGRTSELDG